MSSNRIKAEPPSPSLSIDQAVLMTGISAFTLRNWEKRYDFLRPERRANGFREYSEAQVELLKRIHGLILQGARIGELATVIRRGKALPSLDSGTFDPAVQAEALELYARLRDYDLTGAEAKVAALESVYIPEQMLDLIYQPLLSKIGREWAGGRANIAQEHFASAFIRVRLAHYMTLPAKDLGTDSSRRRLLLASVSGEHHEGGLMLLTAHLRLRGWLPYFLGAGVSVPELHSAAQTIQPSA
jgi:DNA-binding transcriptional MerR regulator